MGKYMLRERVHVYAHTHPCLYNLLDVFVLIAFRVHMLYINLYTYTYTYIHTYIHTYIPTYIHTYIHTCIDTLVVLVFDTCACAFMYAFIHVQKQTRVCMHMQREIENPGRKKERVVQTS